MRVKLNYELRSKLVKGILKQVIHKFSFRLENLFLQKTGRFGLLAFTLIVCVFSFLAYVSVSLNLFSTTIGSRGAVKTMGIGVYWDSACSNPVSNIDWGIVDPGLQKNVTMYMRNEANVPASISLDTVNWDPPNASSYITLSWDYSGQLLEPNESIEVTFTLSISSSVQNITDFDFDIVITGVG